MVADAWTAISVATYSHCLAAVLALARNVMRCQLGKSATQGVPCRAESYFVFGLGTNHLPGVFHIMLQCEEVTAQTMGQISILLLDNIK